jgi:DNA invertase Pin-like site-specific DNA recombinase
LLSILQRIEQAGASFQSLTEPIDTSTPAGRMMMHMLGAFAEFERSIIRERSMAGQRAAKERGTHCGRARNLTKEDESEVVRIYNTGKVTMRNLGFQFNCSESVIKRSIYRVNKPNSSSVK